MPKYYNVKEITCPECEGYGILYDEYEGEILEGVDTDENDCQRVKHRDDEYEVNRCCPLCSGSGYITTETTEEGYSVYNEKQLEYLEQPYYNLPERKITPLTVDELGDCIAEYYGILDYKCYVCPTDRDYLEFATNDMIYVFALIPYDCIDWTDIKPLVKQLYNVQGWEGERYPIIYTVYKNPTGSIR